MATKTLKTLKRNQKVLTKLKSRPAIAQLSDDELRAKTQELKIKLMQLQNTLPIKVVEVHEQIKKSSDVDEKEKLLGK